MANKVQTVQTTLKSEEAIVRAVQFFPGEKWRVQSHVGNAATFEGKPGVPWFLMLLTIVGLFFFILPGIILYVLLVRKVNKFVNLIVTANDCEAGSELTFNYPKQASKVVGKFVKALPKPEPVIQAA